MAATRRSPATRGGASGRGGGGLTVPKLEEALAAGRVEGPYLCLGEETWLARSAVDAIERHVGCEWGKEEFSAAETGAREILRAATSAPLLGGRQLVVVRAIERLRKADKELFPRTLAQVPETTVLVMTAVKLDGRTNFARELQRACRVVHCEPLDDARVPAWIKGRLGLPGRDCKGERGVVERLHEVVGNDLGTLDGEIDKLVQYVGERRRVTLEDVDRVAAGGVGAGLADLVQAVGDRNLPRALACLADVLEAGEQPLRVLAMLGFRVHDLWRAQDIGRQPGVWLHPEARRQTRHFQPAELRRAASLLFDADRRLKTSGGDPRLVLESLVRKVGGTD